MPPFPPIEADRFLFTRQGSTDYFDYYRAGTVELWKSIRPHREAAARLIALPRPRKPFAPLGLFELQALKHRQRYRQYKAVDIARRARSMNVQKAQATTPKLNITAARLWKAGLRVVMMLGHGSFGLAVLFEAKNRFGDVREFVCKMSWDTSVDRGIEDEKVMQGRLQGAKHITQCADLHSFFHTKQSESATNTVRARQTNPVRINMFAEQEPPVIPNAVDIGEVMFDYSLLLQDYARHGDLAVIIKTAGFYNVNFPNRVLWRIWKCLVQGVIEMEFPTAFHGEGWKGIPAIIPTSIVHFDIDPSNVFAFDFDKKDHLYVPRFRYADFGVARTWTDAQKRDPSLDYRIWNDRPNGKTGTLTPESFTENWDYVKYNPYREATSDPDDRIAGHYGWKTNLFQAALCMWSCITKHYVLYPPVPEGIADPRGGNRIIQTHGKDLDHKKFEGVDRDLRKTIALCLAYRPDDRPEMDQLLQQLEYKLGETFNESDERMREFAANIFLEPTPPHEVSEWDPANPTPFKLDPNRLR